jgi:uncharacterized protein (TIGR03083 family)
VDRADVLSMYADGVGAVRATVRGWSPERWRQPACGPWTATDVAGHLVAVVGWYHAWLDRAEAGDGRPPFGADELPDRNRRALEGLRPRGGEDRIDLFVEEAERYAERLDSSWALPYGCPYGTLPAGAHAALAALEWHLHAWDLSAGTHRPSDSGTLLVIACRAFGRARPGLRTRIEMAVAPLVGRSRPWERILERSGRFPAPGNR